ncbi:MAG: hypothetical protein CVV47_17025 [Spirochaetae bacterium HGW-Spirochaetae-3]|nr:MAG: hypothetical protein CVV47_17025 [Spirochaetae bacterium HGW-Spirochaetae-3]
MFSNGLSIGLALGISFLVVHSAAAASALLLPARFGRARIFAFAAVGAAIAASLCASIIRLLDPFLFESAYGRIFIIAFTLPVCRACIMPETIADRERGVENVVRGLAYALVVAVTGAVREFIASGTVSVNYSGASTALLPIAAQPAGAFILIGLCAAGFNAVMRAAKGSER